MKSIDPGFRLHGPGANRNAVVGGVARKSQTRRGGLRERGKPDLLETELAVGWSSDADGFSTIFIQNRDEGDMIRIENVSRRGFLKGMVGAGAFVLSVRLMPEALPAKHQRGGVEDAVTRLHFTILTNHNEVSNNETVTPRACGPRRGREYCRQLPVIAVLVH